MTLKGHNAYDSRAVLWLKLLWLNGKS